MFSSPYPDVDIPDLSVHDHLFGGLSEADLDRVALVDGTTGASGTYRTLVTNIGLVAGYLAAHGVKPGDVVGLLSPNIPAFAPVFHGILRAGAAATTINALYTAEEVAHQLQDAGATWLFTIAPFLERAEEAARTAGIPAEQLVVIGGDGEAHPAYPGILEEGHLAPDVTIDPATHIAVLPFSSGTTSAPKGVMLTHRNLVANVQQARALLEVVPEDRLLALLPFFHIYGMTVLLNLALAERASLVTMPKFDLTEFLRIIQEHRISYLFIAPPVAVALAKHPLVAEYDLSSVHTALSGAAPLDEELGHAVAERIGCRMLQGYGMSEMSPVSHLIPRSAEGVPLGSCGYTVPNMDMRIVDLATGEDIDPPAEGVSEPGHLLCRGPNVMLGYLNLPEATAEALDTDGFLHTGDIATVSSTGVVTIVDRLKELIKYKGYQIPPAELEAVLLTHPEIADAAVVGAYDEDHQEVPKAFVVRQAGSALDAEGVMSFVAKHVAPHKKVRQVEFLDAIPKSASGKILRRELRKG
ncbi:MULTISPECIES: AMP-binding protein [Arthrobacter]|uniref:AMP-binding protein n=2 Tax=Arthrobacter TaxID=1663 RepID=A0ABU9KIV2_9MICC|nr:AMP-binding protein [Arthrobacter sp. YJM1]MDP5226478.1 AMP-binding protein [Arthrobacter sp. YJM1]